MAGAMDEALKPAGTISKAPITINVMPKIRSTCSAVALILVSRKNSAASTSVPNARTINESRYSKGVIRQLSLCSPEGDAGEAGGKLSSRPVVSGLAAWSAVAVGVL